MQRPYSWDMLCYPWCLKGGMCQGGWSLRGPGQSLPDLLQAKECQLPTGGEWAAGGLGPGAQEL